ncbi:hypothetical protein EVAR_84692_1 [Eumeta japonica]|uniref:CDK-activating kinase assembly factor MAT1 n=1 Tax=Eumeta variegata TaxID=151549 RepID=A0A4C1VT17_EUMVA|nr:hypothetical protein EVAR_84692_1 [Eumeta japonica]
MDDQACPRCKTTKYRNPSLKLMVNVCGHALCESCVDLLFLKGSGSCPECNVPLRRSNFRVQLFEDAMVEKEIDIRKRVLKDFNKKEEDFNSLRDYNDYLEEIETIIYNLTNNIDVIATNKKIEHYKKENKELISKNKVKIGPPDHPMAMMLSEEPSCTSVECYWMKSKLSRVGSTLKYITASEMSNAKLRLPSNTEVFEKFLEEGKKRRLNSCKSEVDFIYWDIVDGDDSLCVIDGVNEISLSDSSSIVKRFLEDFCIMDVDGLAVMQLLILNGDVETDWLKGFKGREELELEEILEIEKQMEDLRRSEALRLEHEAKKQKIREKEALIDELMFAEGDAKEILNTFTQNVLAKQEEEPVSNIPKVTQFSTGVKFTRGTAMHQPIPIIEEGPLYKYEPPLAIDTCGPDVPTLVDIVEGGYLDHIRVETEIEKAGGYTSSLPCMRALQAALSGLYHAS